METTENQIPAPAPLEPDKTGVKIPQSPIKMLFNPTPKLKLLLIVGGILILLAIFSLLVPKPPSQPGSSDTKPLPSAISNASIEPRKVSEFGNTADFINFETTLKQLKADVISINLSESELTFPVLDMDVNFEKR